MGVEIFTCVTRRKPQIDVIFFFMKTEKKVLKLIWKRDCFLLDFICDASWLEWSWSKISEQT